jgi:hypothetical protein
MKDSAVTTDSVLITGYAWHIYPDPAASGTLLGDSPFNTGDPRGPDRPPHETPPGLSALWTVHGKVPALVNQVEDRAYLALSEKPTPPAVTSGWFVEAARLAENFELDQRGGRSARLIRVIRTVETPWGLLQECEFQIDRL